MKNIKNPTSFTSPSHIMCIWMTFVFGVGVFIMETKKCIKCGEVKLISSFSKKKKNDNMFYTYCKSCINKQSSIYRKTKGGILSAIYIKQKQSSIDRNHPQPSYTKDELKNWLFSQPLFHELYDSWKNNGYVKGLKPSVDRPDDYKGYSLDNIQLMTWAENDAKAHIDQINGINNKQSKSVLQYDLYGNFIKEYYSIAQASRESGVNQKNIWLSCNYNNRTAGGFKWSYKF